MGTLNLGHVVGEGIPSGGTDGQVLVKSGSTSYSAAWGNVSGLPAISALVTELAGNEAALAVVVNGNTAPSAIAAGTYLFIKNHSTLPSGGYHATAAIASGGTISSSNVAADTDGIANALNRNTSNYDLGTFSTFSAFETALYNYISGIPIGAERYVSFALTVIQLPFADTTYFANVKKSLNGNYLCDARTVLSNEVINGRYRTSTAKWYWNNHISDINAQMANKPMLVLADTISSNTGILVFREPMTFANGECTKNISSHVPSGYTVSSIAFAVCNDTGSLAVTGCNVSNSNLKVRLSNQSYSGEVAINVLLIVAKS